MSSEHSNRTDLDSERPPDARLAQIAYYGDGGLASCLRIVRGATPEKKLRVFELSLGEAIGLARKARLDEVDVIDRFYNLAVSDGLVEQHGEDAIQTVLARAVSGPKLVPIGPLEDVQPARFAIFNASYWQGAPVPARRWLVPHRIPMRSVTLLQGDGATGKTTITLQLQVGVDQGTDWLGAVVDESGPSLFVSAEEEHGEIHRRLGGIIERRGLEFENLNGLHLVTLSDDPTLGALIGGKIVATPLYRKVEEAACDYRVKLLALEAAADLFGGDENNRGQVRQFIGLLRGLAQKADAAVVLLQHPSLSGLANGTGNSGSTHWSNSVRSRLYFSKRKKGAEEDADPGLRQLEVMKANYGPAGERVLVRWDRGVFVPDLGPSGPERAAKERNSEDAFLRCLDIKRTQGIEVVATTGRGYAPATFDGMPEAGGLNRRALKMAMDRLLAAERIRLDVIGGPPSRPRRGLVRI